MSEQFPVVVLNGKRLIAIRDDGEAEYPLMDPENKMGDSYAHVYADGKIMRYRSVIGDVDDLEWTEETEAVTADDLMGGSLSMLGFWQ